MKLTLGDIHEYQVYLTQEREVSWSYFNQAVCALRFFYSVSLRKDWDVTHIPYRKTGRKLPEVLSFEEVSDLFDALPNLKHRTIFMTLYAGGLRTGESVSLRVTGIDGKRMKFRLTTSSPNR